MSIYDMRCAVENVESQLSDLGSYLDDLEEAVDNWEKLQNEGWDDADEVINAIAAAGEWTDLSDSLSMDAEEMKCTAENWRHVCEYFDSAGYYIEGHADVKDVIGKLRAKSDGVEIITALKLLVSALVESGVLAGTASDLAPVKDGEPEPVSEEKEEA